MAIKKQSKRNNLVTEDYLNKKTDAIIEYIDYRLNPIEKFREEFTSFKNQVLKSLDWLVGAFKKFSEEHTVLSESHTRTQDTLDNHEGRIKTLESRRNFSQS